MTIFKGSLIIFAMRILGMLSLVATYGYYSHIDTVENFADFSLILSILVLTGTVSRFGFDQLLVRDVQNIEKNKQLNFLFNSLFISFLLTIIVSIATYIFYHDIMLAGLVVLYSMYSFFPEYYRAIGSSIMYSFMRNLMFNCCLLFSVFISLTYSLGNNLSIIFWPTLIVFLTSLVIFVKKIDVKYNLKINKKIIYSQFIKAIPIFVFQIIIMIQTYGYNLYLKEYGTSADIARYTVFLQGILVFSMFSTSVGMHVAKDIAISISEGKYSKVKSMYIECCKSTVLILSPIFFIVLCSSSFIINTLFDIDVSNEINYFYLMCTSAFIGAIAGPKYTVVNLLGYESYLLKVSLLCQIFTLVGMIVFAQYENKLFIISSLYCAFTLVNTLLCLAKIIKVLRDNERTNIKETR